MTNRHRPQRLNPPSRPGFYTSSLVMAPTHPTLPTSRTLLSLILLPLADPHCVNDHHYSAPWPSTPTSAGLLRPLPNENYPPFPFTTPTLTFLTLPSFPLDFILKTPSPVALAPTPRPAPLQTGRSGSQITVLHRPSSGMNTPFLELMHPSGVVLRSQSDLSRLWTVRAGVLVRVLAGPA